MKLYKNKEYLEEQYLVNKKSIKTIANEIGCVYSTIWSYIKKFNFPIIKQPRTTIGDNNPAKRLDVRKKISESKIGDKNPNYGKYPSEEVRKGRSERLKNNNPMKIKMYRDKISGDNHYLRKCPEKREIRKGSNNPNWKGGIAFLPYCGLFNNKFKEYIRNKFGRKCFICGKLEENNKRKLAIHHIDYNKNSICNGKEWAFVPLCTSCHGKTSYAKNRWYWFNLLINYWLFNNNIILTGVCACGI